MAFSLFLVGCTCKQDIVYKYMDRNITIPNEFFTCKDVEAFIVDKNTTKNAWRLHVGELKAGYESCKETLKRLKQRYGNGE